MLDVLPIAGPIFLAGLLGVAAPGTGLFAKSDMRVLGWFVVNIALPALLFNAVSQRPIGDVLNGSYLLAFLGARWHFSVPVMPGQTASRSSMPRAAASSRWA